MKRISAKDYVLNMSPVNEAVENVNGSFIRAIFLLTTNIFITSERYPGFFLLFWLQKGMINIEISKSRIPQKISKL